MRPGDLFADRYRIGERLGEGGMGVVRRALDERLGRQVALKIMRSHLGDDPTFRARFEREAATAAGFEHPNVVPVYDYAEHDGTLYLVMRHVAGGDLRQELQSTGRLGLPRTVELVRQIAAGLSAGHRSGHVHRDVKPANVLLGRGPDGREQALLTDFGLAQPQDAVRGLTTTGLLLGTIAYMSPEQLRGDRATVRSDVYALACVAYECLTGRTPFSGVTDVQTAQGHLSEPVPDPRALAPELPAAIVDVLERGLAKAPEQRPASAEDFAAQLAAAAREAPTHRPDDASVLQVVAAPAPWQRRAGGGRRLLRAARVVAVLALLAGGLAWLAGPSGPLDDPVTPDPADAHDELAARLPAAVYSGCRPDPEREGGGRKTSLKCGTPLDGADELLVTQWSDASAMAADFAEKHGGKPDGRCGSYAAEPPTGLRSTWGDHAPLACFINSEPAAILLWEYPDDALQVVAVRRDRDAPGFADDTRALFGWWTTAVRSEVT